MLRCSNTGIAVGSSAGIIGYKPYLTRSFYFTYQDETTFIDAYDNNPKSLFLYLLFRIYSVRSADFDAIESSMNIKGNIAEGCSMTDDQYRDLCDLTRDIIVFNSRDPNVHYIYYDIIELEDTALFTYDAWVQFLTNTLEEVCNKSSEQYTKMTYSFMEAMAIQNSVTFVKKLCRPLPKHRGNLDEPRVKKAQVEIFPGFSALAIRAKKEAKDLLSQNGQTAKTPRTVRKTTLTIAEYRERMKQKQETPND